MRRAAFAPLLLALVAGASAQSELTGEGRYPQFRGLSGLPGGGFGVSPDGRLGVNGAMAFSTPVAYSLRPGRGALAYSSISRDGNFRFGNSGSGDANTDANGSLTAMYGLDLRVGHLTVGALAFSGLFDTGLNAHFTPDQNERPVQFGFGVQDIAGEGGTAGGGIPGDTDNSTSTYVVGTAALRGGVYVSAGIGTARFRHLFASASVPAFKRARFLVEHDGFNLNAFLAYSPDFGRRDEFGEELEGGATLLLGLVRGKYATFAVALHF